MTFEEIVKQAAKAVKKFDVSKVERHIAYEIDIVEEGEGAFYIEFADGKVNVEPYEYYDRDLKITATADNVLRLLEGNPVDDYFLALEGNYDDLGVLRNVAEKPAKKTAKKAPAKETAEKKAPAKKDSAKTAEKKEEVKEAAEKKADTVKEEPEKKEAEKKAAKTASSKKTTVSKSDTAESANAATGKTTVSKASKAKNTK